MNPICPYCPDGLLEPVGLPQDHAGRCTSCGRLHLEGAVPLDYTLGPATWWQGATGDEVGTFGLSSVNPPDGSGIAGLDDRELRRQLAAAASRLRASTTRTSWLGTYGRALVREAEVRNASEGAA